MRNIAKENYEACRQRFIDMLEELKNSVLNENFENVDFDLKESLEYLSVLKKYAGKEGVQEKPAPIPKSNKESVGGPIQPPKAVSMFSLSGAHIEDFVSVKDAARNFIKTKFTDGKVSSVSSAIGRVCRKETPSAFGYVWRFKSDVE